MSCRKANRGATAVIKRVRLDATLLPMSDPWGVDQPAANAGDPERGDEVIAAWDGADLPEVQRLIDEGWELLDDAPLLALLPAAWPHSFRAWVPNRLARYEAHTDRGGQIVDYQPTASDDSAGVDYDDDIERYASLAGLPPMPRNRIWLVKSPWPGVTVDEIYEAVEAVAGIGESGETHDALGAVYRAMLVVRQWSSDQVRATIQASSGATDDLSDTDDLSALRADFERLIDDEAEEIEQKWLKLQGQAGVDLFLIVPLRFIPLARDTQYRGRPLHADDVQALEVRAYRKIL